MHLVIRQGAPDLVRYALHGSVDQEDVEIFLRESLLLLQQGRRQFSVDFGSCHRFEARLIEVLAML